MTEFSQIQEFTIPTKVRSSRDFPSETEWVLNDLRNLLQIETGIVTGELSGSVRKRAEKLKIQELHLGVKDKVAVLTEILNQTKLKVENIAFIGDDMNDLEIMKIVGLRACPGDAMPEIKKVSDYSL